MVSTPQEKNSESNNRLWPNTKDTGYTPANYPRRNQNHHHCETTKRMFTKLPK